MNWPIDCHRENVIFDAATTAGNSLFDLLGAPAADIAPKTALIDLQPVVPTFPAPVAATDIPAPPVDAPVEKTPFPVLLEEADVQWEFPDAGMRTSEESEAREEDTPPASKGAPEFVAPETLRLIFPVHYFYPELQVSDSDDGEMGREGAGAKRVEGRSGASAPHPMVAIHQRPQQPADGSVEWTEAVAPRVATVPDVPEIRHVPEMPHVSEAPHPSAMPHVAAPPHGAETRHVPEMPQTEEPPPEPEAPTIEVPRDATGAQALENPRPPAEASEKPVPRQRPEPTRRSAQAVPVETESPEPPPASLVVLPERRTELPPVEPAAQQPIEEPPVMEAPDHVAPHAKTQPVPEVVRERQPAVEPNDPRKSPLPDTPVNTPKPEASDKEQVTERIPVRRHRAERPVVTDAPELSSQRFIVEARSSGEPATRKIDVPSQPQPAAKIWVEPTPSAVASRSVSIAVEGPHGDDVRATVQTTAEGVQVRIRANDEQTQQALQQGAPELRQRLEDVQRIPQGDAWEPVYGAGEATAELQPATGAAFAGQNESHSNDSPPRREDADSGQRHGQRGFGGGSREREAEASGEEFASYLEQGGKA